MMPLAQVDMFPVRVLVESVRPQLCLSCAHNGCQLLDTFAIVSGQTQLGHLVDTVLSALGLPQLIQDSRGLIQINNWKPLSFETITDNKEEPVANLFKEISSNIVLKILTKHSSTDLHNSSQCITSIKQRLLKIAMEKQPHLLTSMDNHDIKETIQQLISGEDAYNLTNETITAINEWLDQISNESSIYKNTIQATRGFNVIEIAKLEQWFLTEQNPQRPKLLNYMNTLNNSPYRRSGSKVTYQQICNWFTNQRAVLRKQQQIAHNLQQQTLNNNSGAGLAAIAVSEFQQLRNAFTATGNEVTNSDVQMTEASSSSNGINTSTSTFLHAPTLGLMTSSGGGSPTTVGSATASTTVSAAGSTAGTTDIPIATLPVDIASKFGASNGCSALLEGSRHGHHSDGERIDGGSESPNGNDDTSVQSPSEQNAYDMDVKESGASSPTEMIIDVNVMSPSSNSLRHQSVNDIFGVFPTNTSGADPLNVGQITPATAAAAAAAMFGLASGDSVNGQNMQDFACQNGVNGAQNNQLMAAFSSLMPSLLGSGSPFNTSSNFLNGTGTTASVPPQSNSPISSTAINGSHGNGIVGNHFGGGLKATSSFFKDDGMIKQDASMNNNNNTPNNNNNNNNTARSRLMFDPLSELPVLERWFENNPHPGCLQIEQYTEKLNSCQYRQNYPPISTHNVKIWFKNRRAKCKRLNLSGNPSDTTPKSTALSV